MEDDLKQTNQYIDLIKNKNGKQPQFSLEMEDNLIFYKMEDDLNCFLNGRHNACYIMKILRGSNRPTNILI